VKALILNSILVVLLALFSLPFMALFIALYGVVFAALGGGWAYAGSSGCHFVIGPVGYYMLGPPIIVVGGVAWLILRKIRALT
jgi:hypothetical protein